MRLSRAMITGAGALSILVLLIIGARAAGEVPAAPSEPLFVAQIILLLVVGRMLGEVMQRIGQPAIMGQLLAGILLGPSVLGAVLPQVQHAIFPSGNGQRIMIDGVSELGILLLLLLTGMETDLALIVRLRRAAASVSIAGIGVPFGCGVLLGAFIPQAMLPRPELRLITALFLGAALSISSVKIVAAVVHDMNFMRRTIGQLIVASAIIDDTIGWIVISVIFGLALHGRVEVVPLGLSIVGTAVFLALSLTLGQRAVAAVMRWTNDNFISELPVITAILVIMGVMALITNLIGVHTVLGAFVAGVLVGRSPILTQHVHDQLRGPIVALFMPVFFGIAGLTTDLTVLRDPALLSVAGGLILIASLGKFGGAFLGGTLAGLSRRECLALGCGMNARGSTEVIFATIGLAMGALNQTLYTMIVAMAFVTTMAMPPMLRWALARLPISPEEADRLAREAIEAKGFIGNLERLLVAVDHSANGRFAARLGGIVSAWRRIPITVLELAQPAPAGVAASPETVAKDAAETTATEGETSPAAADVTTRRQRNVAASDAIASEARKGYGLLMIGVDETTGADGGFHGELAGLGAGFDGPLAVVVARGAARQDPVASGLDILVPITGTQETRRALEVALALARAGTAPLTLLHVVPTSDAWRGNLTTRLRQADGEVLKQAVGIAEHYQIETRSVVRRGISVEDAIIDQLQRGRHDLVVLGVRARSGETLFFGKVAAEVMERSPASVMLISG
jgi:Kef-type K+ transport system membrane component KefB/nucleotide-binding universal stress UspA family protein